MKTIDLFYQGGGLTEIEHLEIAAESNVANLKARLFERHGCPPDTLLFLEDEDEPLDDAQLAKARETSKGVKLHLNRCRQIAVSVMFNGETVERKFAPGATLARVKRWAAEGKFGMNEEEAGEHVLQIAGTHERPAPGTHIGAIVQPNTCAVAFDLVADERVNGASGSAR